MYGEDAEMGEDFVNGLIAVAVIIAVVAFGLGILLGFLL